MDVENGFEPALRGDPEPRRRSSRRLKDAAKDADDIYLATDPDREGEAIGWHLAEELGGEQAQDPPPHVQRDHEERRSRRRSRIPAQIDEQMVDAQQARRVLDRLVGYKISPLLWDKVRRGLCAGRVQSVALKLVCDREREIEQFVPEEYWNIVARLAGPQPPEFDARLPKRERRDRSRSATRREASAILAELEGAAFDRQLGRRPRSASGTRRRPSSPASCSRRRASRSRRR